MAMAYRAPIGRIWGWAQRSRSEMGLDQSKGKGPGMK